MPTYRRSGGSVTRSHLRVRVGGSVLGAGRRIRTPFVDPPPPPPPDPGTPGATVYSAEPLGAGGFVTGISISPDGLTRLSRTDTLGAWRWSSTADAWKPAITGTSMPADGSGNFSSGAGVQAIATVNSIAFMGYRSSIYKSVDKGATWTVSLASGPATAPNNGEQRWYNARLVFDPNNSAVCLYGTYSAGVWFTTNSGSTWTQVASGSVPFGLGGWGIPCVEVDASGNWYAAPYGNGVYKSTNQGSTWTSLSCPATAVAGMKAGPNGDLMVVGGTDTSGTAASSVVYRYRAGAWSNITPVGGRKWRTVAYDPNTAGQVHVQGDGGYQRRSVDYGTTWVEAFQSMSSDGDVPWLAAANGYGADYFFTTLGGLQFDPVTPNRIWMSQGIGVWYADLTTTLSDRVAWQARSRGIEQLVVSDALAPPGGPTLALCWDRALFVTGETGAAPVVTIDPTIATPAGSPATLAATLAAGYPLADMVYAWTVQAQPGGSSGGSFSAPSALSSTFTPDVAGSYTLRLTATNSRGTSHTDVALTATTAVTKLVVPSGNYISAPDRANLDITGDLTLIVKVALDTWQPTSSSNIPLIGKNWLLRMSNVGLSMQIPTSGGSINGNATGALPFAAGSINWCRLIWVASTRTAQLATSPDGVTWTTRINYSNLVAAGSTLTVSSESLVIGHQGGGLQPYLAGKVYRGQVYSGATLVADFNAEPVTRTGTRLPATVTDSTGLVWTPQGTGWDWA